MRAAAASCACSISSYSALITAFFTLTSLRLYFTNASYPLLWISENFLIKSSASGSKSSRYSFTPSTNSPQTLFKSSSLCSCVCLSTSGFAVISAIWPWMESSPITACTASPSARRRVASCAAACMYGLASMAARKRSV